MKKIEELGISPAPWNVKKERSGYYIANAEDTGVASLVRYYSNLECIEADARLIAAAPELYKWLAYSVEHYKCETRTCSNCPNGKCWIVDASAALAKAEGKEATDERK